MSQPAYNQAFFQSQMDESYRSALRILPHLFAHHRPASVIDVGCGVGSWLRAASDLGVPRITGLDGDYVDRAMLMVPASDFRPTDLRTPIRVDARFDLAISVEVAEHLPPERGAGFVADLTRLAPVVLFSAAIPYQGGTDHINENWPDYWAAHFAACGFAPVDVLRPAVWNDPDVCWWYRQNVLVFADADHLSRFPAHTHARGKPLAMVHPELLLWAAVRGRRPDDGAVYHADAAYYRQAAGAAAHGETVPPAQPRAYGPDFNNTF